MLRTCLRAETFFPEEECKEMPNTKEKSNEPIRGPMHPRPSPSPLKVMPNLIKHGDNNLPSNSTVTRKQRGLRLKS